jgi:phosphoglycerol transferase MdoB-like AlkP superfamily enzyme
MLDYSVKVLDTLPQPFLTSYFSLNPHHPFIIPEPWNSQFPKDKKHPILRSLRYVDASLKRFFDKVKDSPWYSNTLFVITADHGGPVTSIMHTKADDYHIPIIVFHPGYPDFKGINNSIINQIDIMPTVLDLLEYPKPYFSLGKSLYSNKVSPAFNLNYRQNLTMYLDSTNYGVWNEERCLSWYDTNKDRLLRRNLAKIPSLSGKLQMVRRGFEKSKNIYYHTMQNDLMSVKNSR